MNKVGYEQDISARNSQFLPTRILGFVVGLQLRLVKLPWQAFLYMVSCLTGMLVQFLHTTGSTPTAFRDKYKLQETLKVVEHLQQREDGFRKKLKESQRKLEEALKANKRLEKKLASARAEASSAPVARSDSGPLPEPQTAAPPSRLLLHVMFWLAGALPAYWLLQQHTVPSISRKFIWTVAAPGILLYSFRVVGSGVPGTHIFINVFSIFISGFVFCHWLLAH
jgi:hypothetical protein